MIFKQFLITIVHVISFLLIPTLVSANTIPWISEVYQAHAEAVVENDTQSGAIPPMVASVGDYPDSGYLGTATITGTYIDVYTEVPNWFEVYATADFSGSYIAEDATNFFNFTYSLDIVDLSAIDPYSSAYAWLRVTDQTDNATLYFNSSLQLSSSPNTISVYTIPGHEISIDIGASSYNSYTPLSAGQSVTLSYDMSIVPEPLSSTLFLIGGATLGFRRFRKKFQK